MLVALMVLGTTADAADAMPGLTTVSAAPLEAGEAQVELGGGFAQVGFIWFGGHVARGTQLRGSVAVSDRTHLDLLGGFTAIDGCTGHRMGGCTFEQRVDATLRLGAAVIDKSRLRVSPYVAAGTTTGAGMALWATTGDRRFDFDVSWGVMFETRALLPLEPTTWEEMGEAPVAFKLDRLTYVPEAGMTVHLDRRDLQHLRLGWTSFIPTVGYRIDPGNVSFEVTAGTTVMYGSLVAGSVGGNW